jgi:hypothetical protein
MYLWQCLGVSCCPCVCSTSISRKCGVAGRGRKTLVTSTRKVPSFPHFFFLTRREYATCRSWCKPLAYCDAGLPYSVERVEYTHVYLSHHASLQIMSNSYTQRLSRLYSHSYVRLIADNPRTFAASVPNAGSPHLPVHFLSLRKPPTRCSRRVASYRPR